MYKKKISKKDRELIEKIDELAREGHPDWKIAEMLNITQHKIDELRGRL